MWQKALEFREAMETAGELEVRRKGQRKRLMWSTIKEAFEDRCASFCPSRAFLYAFLRLRRLLCYPCVPLCLLGSQAAFGDATTGAVRMLKVSGLLHCDRLNVLEKRWRKKKAEELEMRRNRHRKRLMWSGIEAFVRQVRKSFCLLVRHSTISNRP